MSGICDTQGRIGITLSAPLLHPAQPRIAFVLQNPAGLELPYCPTGEFSPLFPPLWRHCIFTLVLLSPSSLSMTLGTKMALSRSRLVPARKPSACQAPTRHRRTLQSAREVLPFHSQSQNSLLIINHRIEPDKPRQ